MPRGCLILRYIESTCEVKEFFLTDGSCGVFARREALVACASPESRCESIFEVDGFSCNNWIFSFQHSYASPKLIENFFCLFYESRLQFGLLLNESKLRAKFDPIRRFSSTKKQKEIVIRKVGTLICFISVSQIRV